MLLKLRNQTLQGRIPLRTPSSIDRAFINVPMAQARDFHYHSHATDNVGERSIRSDHVAVRGVIQTPLDYCGTVKRIPSWMFKHLVFSTLLKQISDNHQYTDEPFAAVADFKLIIEKARKRTRHELLRNAPGSPSAKLLIAATAMRAYRNRHLGTLMHCCAAWEPVGQCFDQCSFECKDNTSKDQFPQCGSLQGIRVQVKIE